MLHLAAFRVQTDDSPILGGKAGGLTGAADVLQMVVVEDWRIGGRE